MGETISDQRGRITNWDDLYPELVNKMRWAVQTTFTTGELSFPYGTAQKVATVLAQDVVDIMKLSASEPAVLDSTGSIRAFYAQKQVDGLT